MTKNNACFVFLSLILISCGSSSLSSYKTIQNKNSVNFLEFDSVSIPSGMVQLDGRMWALEVNRSPTRKVHRLWSVDHRTGSTSHFSVSTGAHFLSLRGDHQLVISDPWDDHLQIFNTQKNELVLNRKTPKLQGAWETTIGQGVIYGSNRFNKLITRYHLSSKKHLPAFQVQKATGSLAIQGDMLLALENTVMTTPADTWAFLDKNTGDLIKRYEFDGKMSRFFRWKKKLCGLLNQNTFHGETDKSFLVCILNKTPVEILQLGYHVHDISFYEDSVWILVNDESRGYKLINGQINAQDKFVFKKQVFLKEFNTRLKKIYNISAGPSNSVFVRGDMGIYQYLDK